MPPINRDGKHWCAPERETPAPRWVCPDCQTEWLFTETATGGLWEKPADREQRLVTEQWMAEGDVQ